MPRQREVHRLVIDIRQSRASAGPSVEGEHKVLTPRALGPPDWAGEFLFTWVSRIEPDRRWRDVQFPLERTLAIISPSPPRVVPPLGQVFPELVARLGHRVAGRFDIAEPDVGGQPRSVSERLGLGDLAGRRVLALDL